MMMNDSSLTPSGMRTVYDTILRLEESKKKDINGLADIFAEDARLIITPSNQCDNFCFHCVADSLPSGEMMDYDKFVDIDPRFIQLFSFADFGRRGNPLNYSSKGKDLADLIVFLNNNSISNFSIAATANNKDRKVLEKLNTFVSDTGATIETMITYHHYFPRFDKIEFAHKLNSAIKDYIAFSQTILISLLGDRYADENSTMAEEVAKTFYENWEIIFNGISLEREDNKRLIATYEDKSTEIIIPSVDTKVYPMGRFEEYLSRKGCLEGYSKKLNESLSDYVCPDLIRWPGAIIEPNGDLNLCASFEAIVCNKAIVTNIFNKTYAQVEEELMSFHKREIDWFLDNLPGIIAGKVSTCKMKNNCYL